MRNLVISCVVMLSGCGDDLEEGCAAICDKGDACDSFTLLPLDVDIDSKGECEDECVALVEDEDGACHDDVRELGECVEELSCSELEAEDFANDCQAEAFGVVQRCNLADELQPPS